MTDATPLASEQITQADVTDADKAAVTRFHAIQLKRIMAGDRTLGDNRDTIEQAFTRHRIETELRLSASPAPVGWKLVPVDPTEAMIDRFVSRALCVSVHGDGGWSRYAREQWSAMIAASPAPSGRSGDTEPCPTCNGSGRMEGLSARTKARIAKALASDGMRCANCGSSDFKSVIAGDDGEAFCSVDCADQHEALGCPLETGNSYRDPAPSGQGVSGEVRCAASPDHADIMETIENAADDWQRKGYTSALAEVRDMANVGRALMEALPEGYSYMNCPSEIVSDLQNERDEALAAPAPSCAAGEVERGTDWTGGRAWPDLLDAIAKYWTEWEEDRAGTGTYTVEELAEDGGGFATGLADYLAALSPQGLDAKEGGE